MRRWIHLGFAALTAACTHMPDSGERSRLLSDTAVLGEVRTTRHDGADDLLSAGLGLDGLRHPIAPAPADADAPTPQELRRRAIHTNWRGIVDLVPGGGFGTLYGAAPHVPGREYAAFARVPGATHPHRVLAQVPDAFDRKARCLVVAPASGSRGVYGAIGFAGAWALPRGCAVVYTDKGAGPGAYDVDTATGVRLDGTRGSEEPLDFVAAGTATAPHRVALKHAHSQDNPEADWGRHVIQAMQFGLEALDRAFPEQAPFTPENTRIIAAGLSNGGGAVLRAAELPESAAFDAVVAAAPNVQPDTARALFDYGTEAALLMPCALLDDRLARAPTLTPAHVLQVTGAARCSNLRANGWIEGNDVTAQAASAYDRLIAGGWDASALDFVALNVGFDLWRAIGAVYVAAYSRSSFADATCGFAFAMKDPTGVPRAGSAAERALWWSDGGGVAPMAGIELIDGNAQRGLDPGFAGVSCLRETWTGDGNLARRVRDGVAATRASGQLVAPRVAIVHGRDDGLVPASFTSRPYVAAARERSPHVALAYWEVADVQHFDAFLGFPQLGSRYLPLLPYAWQALDAAWASITTDAPLPKSGPVAGKRRAVLESGMPEPLSATHLGHIGAGR